MGDGCESCMVMDGWRCSGISPSECVRIDMGPRCGDGEVDDGEGCDDGNMMGGDGCSFSCQVEDGFDCDG